MNDSITTLPLQLPQAAPSNWFGSTKCTIWTQIAPYFILFYHMQNILASLNRDKIKQINGL
jgi:hypothetical protein